MLSATCPGCGKKLQVKDELGGKKVRCPGCKEIFTLPLSRAKAEEPAEANGEETENEDTGVKAGAPSKGPARPERRPQNASAKAREEEEEEEEEDERPAKASKKGSKRRDEEDEEDEEKRPRKTAKKKSGISPLLIAIPVALVLLCGGGIFGAYYVVRSWFHKTKEGFDQAVAEMSAKEGGPVAPAASGSEAQQQILGKWVTTDFGNIEYEFMKDGTFTMGMAGRTQSGTYKVIDDHTLEMHSPMGQGGTMKMTISGDSMELVADPSSVKVEGGASPLSQADLEKLATLHFKRPGSVASKSPMTPAGAGATPAALTGQALAILGKWNRTDPNFTGTSFEFKDNGTFTLSQGGGTPMEGTFKSVDELTIELSAPIAATMRIAVSGQTLTLTNLVTNEAMHLARPGATPAPATAGLVGKALTILGKWYCPELGKTDPATVEFKNDGTYTVTVSSATYNGTFRGVDENTIETLTPDRDQKVLAMDGGDITLTGHVAPLVWHLKSLSMAPKPSTSVASVPPTTPKPDVKPKPAANAGAHDEEEAAKLLQSAKHAQEDFVHKFTDYQKALTVREKTAAGIRKAQEHAAQLQQQAAQAEQQAKKLYSEVIQKYPTTPAAAQAQQALASLP